MMNGQVKKQQDLKNILEMVFIGFGDEMHTRDKSKGRWLLGFKLDQLDKSWIHLLRRENFMVWGNRQI